jgi:hypothetical protein
MTEQFENPEAIKLENETVSDAGAQKRIEHVAEKAAEKASRAEQSYDQNHEIFSK